MGLLPLGALAWRLSNESFLEPVEWLNTLKLRTSYGRTGLSNSPDFLYRTFFEPGNIYNNVNGTQPISIPNPNVGWQTSTQLDVGVDFSVLDRRLNGTVDYFNKYVHDMFLYQPLSPTTGFNSYYANIGEMSSWGWEFSLNGDIIQNGSFNWNAQFNISFVDNRLEALNDGGWTTFGTNSFLEVGQPLGFVEGYIKEGIFQSQEEIDALNAASPSEVYQSELTAPGDYRFRDVNGDGRINAEDQVSMGTAQPDFYGGFTNNFYYAGFELMVHSQFSYGNSKLWLAGQENGIINGDENIISRFAEDAWSPENTDAQYPRLVLADPNINRRLSTAFFRDASFFRIKRIRAGYNLPQTATTRAGIQSVKVFASATNLFTITRWPGLDPETATPDNEFTNFYNYIDRDAYPLARIFAVGLNVQL